MTDAPPAPVPRPRSAVALEVERIVARSGKTQAEVAAYLSEQLRLPPAKRLQHYHVSRMVSGARKVSADEMQLLRALIEEGDNEASSAPKQAVNSAFAALTGSSEHVPLFSPGAGGRLRLTEDFRVGVARIHPLQQGRTGAFAFIVHGDALGERLPHGDTAYAVRNQIPARGRPCLVELSDGSQHLCFYDGQDENTLFASVRKPKEKQTPFPLRDVAGVHAIVGSGFS